jgi:hypothetical protein
MVGTGAREVRRGGIGSAVRRRVVVGTDTCGPDSTFKAWRDMWRPHSDGVLTGRPGAERGRLTGGSHVSAISELKFTPGRK